MFVNHKLYASAALIALIGMASFGPAQAQTFLYTGDAYNVSASVLNILGVKVNEAGPIPSTGGNLSANLASATVTLTGAPVLTTAGTTGALNASSASNNVAHSVISTADTLNLSLFPGVTLTPEYALSADEVLSSATATTSNVSGSTTITNLKFGGNSITVTGNPNQTVTLLDGTILVINEQISTVSGGQHLITVNALDLTVPSLVVPNGIKVIVSSSTSGVSATPEPGSVAMFFSLGVSVLCVLRRRIRARV